MGLPKVYGPYTRKADGRQVVELVYQDGSRRHVSYPKWLMEQHLGRELDPELETVDHIDRDFTNNALSNLRVIPRSRHASEDAVRVELVEFACVECGLISYRSGSQLRRNSRLGKAGPFCTKSCAGSYTRRVQLGLQDRLPPQDSPDSVYYREKLGVKHYL